jgi:hypothetical protein
MGGIEPGERNLTLKSVERIAEKLGVDPMKLLLAVRFAEVLSDEPKMSTSAPPEDRDR